VVAAAGPDIGLCGPWPRVVLAWMGAEGHDTVVAGGSRWSAGSSTVGIPGGILLHERVDWPVTRHGEGVRGMRGMARYGLSAGLHLGAWDMLPRCIFSRGGLLTTTITSKPRTAEVEAQAVAAAEAAQTLLQTSRSPPNIKTVNMIFHTG
jgi:hypothetical protein